MRGCGAAWGGQGGVLLRGVPMAGRGCGHEALCGGSPRVEVRLGLAAVVAQPLVAESGRNLVAPRGGHPAVGRGLGQHQHIFVFAGVRGREAGDEAHWSAQAEGAGAPALGAQRLDSRVLVRNDGLGLAKHGLETVAQRSVRLGHRPVPCGGDRGLGWRRGGGLNWLRRCCHNFRDRAAAAAAASLRAWVRRSGGRAAGGAACW
mmetsp:Transcript_1477/g.5824  ORF Transcript_1477/g.5824 Transcript_1477/m.5824 type:complete len:204 (+) Transcript_1477:184-795(+)